LGEWRCSSTHSLTSALDGDKRSVSRPGRFTPRERAPGTHWIGGWVSPRAVLNAVVKSPMCNFVGLIVSQFDTDNEVQMVQDL
jgi:hypothetical protein